MRKYISVILMIFLGAFILVSLGVAFSEWNLNPGKWKDEARSCCAVVSLIAGGIISFMVTSDMIEENRTK